MKRIIAVVMAGMVAVCGAAEWTISEAFGMRLGADAPKNLTYGPDYNARFTPKNKYRGFEKYVVSVTPKTKRIAQVNAAAQYTYAEKDDSLGELAVLLQSLKNKYPKLKFITTDDLPVKKQYFFVEQNGDASRLIVVSWQWEMDEVNLFLMYIDPVLGKRQNDELAELRAAKSDDSGL